MRKIELISQIILAKNQTYFLPILKNNVLGINMDSKKKEVDEEIEEIFHHDDSKIHDTDDEHIGEIGPDYGGDERLQMYLE